MEHIKEAIQKAKLKHASKGKPKGDKFSAGGANANAGSEALGEINYVQTKTVKLDPVHLEKNRIVAHGRQDSKSTIFDILRTKILVKMKENGWKTLAITSPTPQCGKTFVSINLAISIARQEDHTVLLADFDLKRPKVSKYLGLKSQYKLRDYFDGKIKLEEMLVNPEFPHLVVLPNDIPDEFSSDILSSKKMKTLIAGLKDRYESRIIIFDLPPVLSSDDAIAFLPNVDCVLLVVGNGLVSKSDIESSLQLVSTSNLIGTVVNKAETNWQGYY